MSNSILSREQLAVQDFLGSSSSFLLSFKDTGRPDLSDFVEGLIDASSLFGLSELYYRSHDRVERAAANLERLKFLNKAAINYNQKGLRTLELITPLIESELKGLKEIKGEYKPDFLKIRLEYVSYFEELEIKPTDTEKLIRVLDEVISVATKGERELVQYLVSKTQELAKVRSGDDRGAVDNIPWWKIVAIAIYIGLSIWEVIRCYWWSGGCSKVEQGVYKLGQTIASLAHKFC